MLTADSNALAEAKVTLVWDASPEANISGYRLYYGPSSGHYDHAIEVGNKLTSTVSNLPDATTQYFVVTAFNSAGLESVPSQEVSYRTPAGPKAELVGSYSGLLYETSGVDQQTSGSFTVTSSSQGAFSGKLLFAGKRYSFSGQFDQSGKAVTTIPRSGQKPLTLNLQLVPSINQTTELLGSIGDGSWLASLVGNRALFNAKSNPAPYAGKYTLIIPGNDTSSTSPGGDGFASLVVDAAGKVSVKGILADGTKLAAKGQLASNGALPLHVLLYSGQGSILGWLNFTNQATEDLSGLLSWIKPASPTSKYYPAGFSVESLSLGSIYIPSAGKSNPIIDLTQGAMILSGGNVPSPITNPFDAAGKSTQAYSGANNLKLTISPLTGLFKGTVVEPATGKKIKLQGAVLQKQNVGSGFFLGTSQSGRIFLNSVL